MTTLGTLLPQVRACTRCAGHLPMGPRPVLQCHGTARILVAVQAPGRPAGDRPRRPGCAPAWRAGLLAALSSLRLTRVIGRQAQAWHLPQAGPSVTEVVRDWRRHWPRVLPLPHPTPRNNRGLARNSWFEAGLLPALRARVADVLR